MHGIWLVLHKGKSNARGTIAFTTLSFDVSPITKKQLDLIFIYETVEVPNRSCVILICSFMQQ